MLADPAFGTFLCGKAPCQLARVDVLEPRQLFAVRNQDQSIGPRSSTLPTTHYPEYAMKHPESRLVIRTEHDVKSLNRNDDVKSK